MRPVRAGPCLAHGLWPEGVQRLRRSRAGPEDHFRGAVRNDLQVPLTAEGTPDTERAIPGSEFSPFEYIGGLDAAGCLAAGDPGARGHLRNDAL